MANFVPGTDIETPGPTVEVTALPPGVHRFRLIVEDDTGRLSQPAFIDVTVPAPATPENNS
jgi:hypothetical protein